MRHPDPLFIGRVGARFVHEDAYAQLSLVHGVASIFGVPKKASIEERFACSALFNGLKIEWVRVA